MIFLGETPTSQGHKPLWSCSTKDESFARRRRFAALLVPLFGFGLAVSAAAATFTVNSTGDAADPVPSDGVCGTVAIDRTHSGGPCTLRAAIQSANATAGTDTIRFSIPASDPNSVGGVSTINLTQVLPSLSTNMSINGTDPDLLIVRRNAGGSYRVFNLSTSGSVTFSGITISDGQGGILNNNAATVNVNNCILRDNVTPGLGGGIYNNSTGPVNVTDSTFLSNSAGSGGAIYNNSTGPVTVTRSTFRSNRATGSANSGGAISKIKGGTLVVTDTTFTDNFASEGGGIAANNATTVTNCVFQGNGAINGGGIYNKGGTLNVTHGTFTGNGANGDGGGIANDFYGTANVSSSTFSGNFANNGDPTASGGGAICNGDHNHSQGGFMTVTNSTITGNTALRGGGLSMGGTAAAGFLTVTNSTIVGNSSFFSDSAGGISSDNQGPVNIKNTIVALNTGLAGRDVFGIFVSSGFNLIGRRDGSSGFTAATDQTGTIALPLDPKLDLGGLGDNGGLTRTIALQPGSPAIDKGTSNSLTGNLTSDARGPGFPRAADYSNVSNAAGGDGTDIGACEGTRFQITSISRLANGHIVLQGRGIPNKVHRFEASPDLNPNSFTPFPTTVVADGTGVLQYNDATAVGLPKRFFRLRFP